MNAIISAYFSSYGYPFYEVTEKPDLIGYIDGWYSSIKHLGLNAFLLLDCPEDVELLGDKQTDQIRLVLVDQPSGLNQMDIRWKFILSFIKSMPDLDNMFVTDLGDVVVLRDPFVAPLEDKIYVGDDELNEVVGGIWMMKHWPLLIFKHPEVRRFVLTHINHRLLNSGLLGGHREKFVGFLEQAVQTFDRFGITTPYPIDMHVFNYLLYTYYDGEYVHGVPFNTRFRKNELEHPTAWFKHK